MRGGPALRLGFRQIKGFSEDDGEKLMKARSAGYTHPRDLLHRAKLAPGAIERLAEADAFAALGLSRRTALWAAKGSGGEAPPLLRLLDGSNEQQVTMPTATAGEEVINDYSALRLTLREGRNRQVRRMTAAVGFPTLRLIRERIGPHALDDLAPGEWRRLD